jgi:drug/metabolite transporter (DMT)-like permease
VKTAGRGTDLRRGIACALAAACFYGLIPNFVRAAFDNGIPAVESTFVRTLIIAVIFGLWAKARREPMNFPRAAWPPLLGIALSTLLISVCYLASVQFIPVGLAVVIFFTFPVLIMLLAPLVERRSPGLARILLALVAFGGLVLAIGPGFTTLDWRGIALAAFAALGGVVQFLSGRAISRYLTPLAFGAMVHWAILPFTLAIALGLGQGRLQIMPGGHATAMGLVFLAGVGLTYVFAYLLHMLSLRHAAASQVAPFFNLEPLVTSGVAAVLLGERLSPGQYAGGVMVLMALILASCADRLKKNR